MNKTKILYEMVRFTYYSTTCTTCTTYHCSYYLYMYCTVHTRCLPRCTPDKHTLPFSLKIYFSTTTESSKKAAPCRPPPVHNKSFAPTTQLTNPTPPRHTPSPPLTGGNLFPGGLRTHRLIPSLPSPSLGTICTTPLVMFNATPLVVPATPKGCALLLFCRHVSVTRLDFIVVMFRPYFMAMAKSKWANVNPTGFNISRTMDLILWCSKSFCLCMRIN